MTRIQVLACVVSGVALFLGVTEASAGILVSGLEDLKAAAPRFSAEKVHDGYGGMHQGCARHKSDLPDFAGYPDCHWHHYNDVNNSWEIRRRKLDGTPCPRNVDCPYEVPGTGR
jgi:hypothetical protein